MKHGARVLGLVVFAAIAALVAWPVLRIADAAISGREEARAAFLDIRRQAINALAMPEQASGQNWQSVARSAWAQNPRLLALVVSRRDDGVLFAMPSASHYYLEAAPGQSPSYRYPENAVSRFQGPLASGMMIETLFATLTQKDVFLPLRDAALAALALILMCSGWLLASPRRSQTPLDGAEAAIAPLAPSAYGLEAERYGPAVDAEADSLALAYRPDAAPNTVAPADGETDQRTAPAPQYGLSGQAEAHQERGAGQVRCQDLPGGELAGPKGLFDPETGLGWESYLRERLSAELKRSASFEQDLCLLLATLDDSARGQEDFALFAKTAQEFFTFKDLSFIFGDNGVAIILPNMDVDHAIRMSEELLKKLTFLMKGKDGSMSYLELFMGLSSRSGRLVDADRLVGEAFAALGKAREERDTHIMAFRPDPEKFRAFLATR